MDEHNWTEPLFRGLTGAAIWLLAGIILQAIGLTENAALLVVVYPGAFLYRSFLFPALLIPLYMGGLAWALKTEKLRQIEILASPLLSIPLMTISLLVRVTSLEEPNQLSLVMVEGLGAGGSIFFLAILLLLEGLLLYGLWSWLVEKDESEIRERPLITHLKKTKTPEKVPTQNEKIEKELSPIPPNLEIPEPVMESPPPTPDIRHDPFWNQPLPVKSVYPTVIEAPEVVDWDRLSRVIPPEMGDDDPLSEEEFLEEEAAQALEEEWNTPGADPVYETFGRIFETKGAPEGIQENSSENSSETPSEYSDEEPQGRAHEIYQEPRREIIPEEPVPPVALPEREVEESSGGVVREANWSKEIPFVREADRVKFPRYHVPVQGILNHYGHQDFTQIDEMTKRSGHILKMTLEEFNIRAEVTGISKGPVVTMFEILPASGVKLSRIVALADNIALGLAASSVRIVAPIPGKHAVGIEVPNKERAIVGFGAMIDSKEYQETKAEIPIILGQDISGKPTIIDLAKTPHLLIAGATGAGKSVCVNSLICSILYNKSPDEVKLIMVDPKIVELKFFNHIPHLLTPVITEPKRALQAIQWALYEMERRYSLLDALGVRDIRSYNSKVEKRHLATKKLPYIVLVVDEFADLMATSGK